MRYAVIFAALLAAASCGENTKEIKALNAEVSSQAAELVSAEERIEALTVKASELQAKRLEAEGAARELSAQLAEKEAAGELSMERWADGTPKSRGQITQSGVRKGKWTHWDEDGTKHRGQYRNGTRDGVWQTLDDNDLVKVETNYKDGSYLEEFRQEWHPNGVLRSRIRFLGDKESGPYQYFHDNGNISVSGNFTNGKLNGTVTSYRVSGEKYWEENFKLGMRHGPYKGWLIDGKPFVIGNYKEDKKHGEYQSWYSNGQLALSGLYNGGKEDGTWEYWEEDGSRTGELKFFDDNEKVARRITFENGHEIETLNFNYYENGELKNSFRTLGGKRNGTDTSWYRNGRIENEGSYLDDHRVGIHTRWYKSGQKAEQGNFEDSSARGTHIEWYKTGQQSEERVYSDKGFFTSRWYENGAKKEQGFLNLKPYGRTGEWRYWDAEGNLYRESGIYKEDKRIQNLPRD
jgi:uncharacterized protein